ncbi:MAG: MFS transporter [Gemmatimonadales bacterium]
MTESRAGRREWMGLAVLAFPCLLLSMDFTVLHLAVPALTASLAPSSTQLLWIVDIYGFMIGSSLITMGTLGDRIGRRRLLLIGGAVFGIASVGAAFSGSAAMLITTRALLGVAGATLMPSTLALIRNMFHDAHQRRIAIAIWINSFVVGSAIGPLLGGVMLEHFWWGSVFLLNVPVMALLLVLGPILLPEFRDPDAGRLDLFSAALSLVAILAIIYGIKRIAQDGAGSVSFVAIAAGLVVAVGFVMRQRQLSDPLIDVGLFQVPAFSASVATQLVASVSMGGIYLFVAQYLQLVLGLSPFQAGKWLLPSTFAGILGTMLAPFFARRIRTVHVMGAGMIVAAVGMSVLTLVGDRSALAAIVVSFMMISLGFSAAMTLTTDMIMTVAPPERAGAASGISETSAELGMALGVAVLGSIGTASYRRIMASSLPSGIPAEAAANARATLGGAVAAAREIGGERGSQLAGAAREAFAQSLELVATIGAILVVATSIVTYFLLRRAATASEARDQSQVPATA